MQPTGYPLQSDMEIPLLRLIIKHGGGIIFSRQGKQIADELADVFNLKEEHRRYSSQEINSRNRNYWINHIQYVRLKLVEKGELDKIMRDVWSVTRAGRNRVKAYDELQTQEKSTRLNQIIKDDCESQYADLEDQGYSTPDGSPTFYERNPELRKRAIELQGTACHICGFDYGEFYGQKGQDYIEVHHIIPISEVRELSTPDPLKNLIVLCANCHRMIHRRRRSTLHPDNLKNSINHQDGEYGLPR